MCVMMGWEIVDGGAGLIPFQRMMRSPDLQFDLSTDGISGIWPALIKIPGALLAAGG